MAGQIGVLESKNATNYEDLKNCLLETDPEEFLWSLSHKDSTTY